MNSGDQLIYLDNAATTILEQEVAEAMLPYLVGRYGNPSSLHLLGRQARQAVEEARNKIAALLSVHPSTIIFTSGGTESNNTAIHAALTSFQCNHIITSRIEHHAVLHPVEYYAAEPGAGISYVKLTEDGSIDLNDFRRLLEMKTAQGKKCLVTLMHANNETGQLTDIRWIAGLCKKNGAIFHSDCVQTIGHYPLHLPVEGMQLASASAHKFHGPKGVGFLYVHKDLYLPPLIFGGAHENGRRAGTENVASIVGMAKALEISHQNFERDQQQVGALKQTLAEAIKKDFPGTIVNSGKNALYSVVSVSFPRTEQTRLLILQLDQMGICVSGGSACSGGGSHVMKELGRSENYDTVRFSFSRFNTRWEVERVVAGLKQLLKMPEAG